MTDIRIDTFADIDPALFYFGIFLPGLALFLAGATALIERFGRHP